MDPDDPEGPGAGTSPCLSDLSISLLPSMGLT